MQKLWVKVSVAAVALVVLVVVLIPFFVNADTFRPRLESRLSGTLGRKITLGHLGFSLFSGSLLAENIAIADDPAFSTSPFLQAKSLRIGVEMGPLLFQRQVRITNLVVESPSINLIQQPNGVWNFSSFGGAAATPAPQGQSAIPDLAVSEFKLNNGSATVTFLPAAGKPFVCTGISLAIHQLSFLKPFPFELSAQLPGGGSLQLNGTAGPLSQKNAAESPFKAALQLKHFDPVAAGVVQNGQGVSMVVDIDAQLASDAATLSTTGKIQASNLQLARAGSPAPHPVDIDYTISHDLGTRAGTVSDLAVHAGSVAAHVTGGYRVTGNGVVLDLHLAAPNLPVDQLEQLLPAVGVRLPSGSALKGGAITANLAVAGPVAAATIHGPVEIDNTQLAGFDIGSRIEGLNPFGSKGAGTTIQTLRADLNSTPQSVQVTDIYANLPQLGTATGSGTVSPAGALDFNLVARFSASSGLVGAVGVGATTAFTTVTGLVGGLGRMKPKLPTKVNSGIPLTVTGTTTNPSIRANLHAMLK